jgi:ABC-2 type transport system ATP-binding protein
VAGLVGPNGAGKTTLLHLATGLLVPTSGTIKVLGGLPASSPAQLARVGFVAQDTPTYAGLSVADHLRLGAHLNPAWDHDLAQRRIEKLGLDPAQRAGKLSGGQRAQLALTLAIAKRPELLILDEPVASLDPLARREFLQYLMEAVAEQEVSVVLSSHLVADLERVCDYLIVLVASRVQVADEVEELLAGHHLLTGPRRDPATLPAGQRVIHASHTDRQTSLLVRAATPIYDPAWTVSKVSMEDLVLAYMRQAGTFRLAWNQSVTRTRWLAVKLGLIGLAAMATAGLLSLVVGWWASPIDRALGLPAGRNGTSGINRFAPLLFGARGITPIGYAAFAFALGVTAGVLIRRTIPAMAATLAVFTAALITMSLWVRPHLIAPLHAISALNPANIDQLVTGSASGSQMTVTAAVNLPGAWVLSNQSINASGHVFTGPATQACTSGSIQTCTAYIGRLRLRQLVTYRPASRYWAFQWHETAIFLALALALAGFCFWWIRRRRRRA